MTTLILLALNSMIFSALVLRFAWVTNGHSWRHCRAALRRDWPTALVMAVFGFACLLLIPAVLGFFWIKDSAFDLKEKGVAA
ncbi:MAG: hypothetical protein WD795_18090 [Woeseia sp.]